MALRINNNISALSVQRAISRNNTATNHQVETVASGVRVQRAATSASGLVISEGMRAELAGLSQNLRNTEQASNLLQVAEGSLREVSRILIRMRELAVRSSDGTLTDRQREVVASEFNQSRAAIDRMAQNTTYNNQVLLAGSSQVVEEESSALTQSATTGVEKIDSFGAQAGIYTLVDPGEDEILSLGDGVITQTLDLGVILDQGKVAEGTRIVANFDRLGLQLTLSGRGEARYAAGDLDGTTIRVEETTGGVFQVGPDAREEDRLEVMLADMRGSSDVLSIHKMSVSSLESARNTLSRMDLAIARVAGERGKLGALQNRLASTLAFSENEVENMQASDSTLRDADMAQESSNLVRSQILRQSSSAMLVQAFGMSRLALRLL